MSEKRKDKKGRILRVGESQRGDGKYEYKYLDQDGVRRSLYSWKLVKTDVIPAEKKDDLSLREKIMQMQLALEQGVNISKATSSLMDWVEKYMQMKRFAVSTYENYTYYINKDIRHSYLGRMNICDIKKSDVKRFYSSLSKKGYADGTIQIIHKVIHPALELAIEDEVLGKNPADGTCRDYTSSRDREAMSPDEQAVFFQEVLKCNRYGKKYDLIFRVMLGLACRVSELIGLTWQDVDMKERVVTIDHGIVYRKKNGKCQFFATSGTSKNVKRKIPMTEDVYNCFLKLETERVAGKSKVIDGYTDFVFMTSSGTPLYPANLNKALTQMVEKYKKEANVDFPGISNHIFRHSGCTNMAESEIEPNVLMHVMGHRNLKMIMKVYDTVRFDRIRKQMEKMDKRSAI